MARYTEDSIRAVKLLRPKSVMPIHYNTFPPIRIDSAAAITRFKAAHKNLHLLLPGESHSF